MWALLKVTLSLSDNGLQHRFWIVIVAMLCCTNAVSTFNKNNGVIEFTIDYGNNQFPKDGKPFRYVSGSLPYVRVPEKYWQEKLGQLRALGLNTVCTFIEWSYHEPLPGKFDFSGEKNLFHFIKLAQKEGLLVILRPGPYIYSDRNLGGYPAWLFNKNPDISLRTSDPVHNKYLSRWFKHLFSRLQPLLYGNGGPVIMIQVENEYGSYTVCNRSYTTWLRDLYRSYVTDKTILLLQMKTQKNHLNCTISEVFITVNFGPQKDVSAAFDPLREIQKRGPLVNSQFYVGQHSHWGDPADGFPAHPSIEEIVDSTRQLLKLGASFNYYMIHGGTNCAFQGGSNHPFLPDITSCDFNYPISEYGNLTSKYFAIKAVLSEGILSNVTLNGDVLTHWHHIGYPMEDYSHNLPLASVNSIDLPGYFTAEFELPVSQTLYPDTFVDMTGWSKEEGDTNYKTQANRRTGEPKAGTRNRPRPEPTALKVTSQQRSSNLRQPGKPKRRVTVAVEGYNTNI